MPNPLTKRDQIRNSSVDSHYIERAPTHSRWGEGTPNACNRLGKASNPRSISQSHAP